MSRTRGSVDLTPEAGRRRKSSHESPAHSSLDQSSFLHHSPDSSAGAAAEAEAVLHSLQQEEHEMHELREELQDRNKEIDELISFEQAAAVELEDSKEELNHVINGEIEYMEEVRSREAAEEHDGSQKSQSEAHVAKGSNRQDVEIQALRSERQAALAELEMLQPLLKQMKQVEESAAEAESRGGTPRSIGSFSRSPSRERISNEIARLREARSPGDESSIGDIENLLHQEVEDLQKELGDLEEVAANAVDKCVSIKEAETEMERGLQSEIKSHETAANLLRKQLEKMESNSAREVHEVDRTHRKHSDQLSQELSQKLQDEQILVEHTQQQTALARQHTAAIKQLQNAAQMAEKRHTITLTAAEKRYEDALATAERRHSGVLGAEEAAHAALKQEVAALQWEVQVEQLADVRSSAPKTGQDLSLSKSTAKDHAALEAEVARFRQAAMKAEACMQAADVSLQVGSPKKFSNAPFADGGASDLSRFDEELKRQGVIFSTELQLHRQEAAAELAQHIAEIKQKEAAKQGQLREDFAAELKEKRHEWQRTAAKEMMEAKVELARCKADEARELVNKSYGSRRTSEETLHLEHQLNQANRELVQLQTSPRGTDPSNPADFGKLLATEVKAEAALEAVAASERSFKQEQLPLVAESKQKDFIINSLRDEITVLTKRVSGSDSMGDGRWYAEHSLAKAAVMRLEHQASHVREDHQHDISALEDTFELELEKMAHQEAACERHVAIVQVQLEQCERRAQMFGELVQDPEAFNRRLSEAQELESLEDNPALKAKVIAMETLAQVRFNELEQLRHELDRVKAVAQGSIRDLESTARKEVDRLVHLSKAENIGRMIGAAQFQEALRTPGLLIGRDQRHRRAATVAKMIAYHSETLGSCFWQWQHSAVHARVAHLGKLLDTQSSANRLLAQSLEKWCGSEGHTGGSPASRRHEPNSASANYHFVNSLRDDIRNSLRD